MGGAASSSGNSHRMKIAPISHVLIQNVEGDSALIAMNQRYGSVPL